MGAPPRTRSFAAAAANARRMETEWGNLRVVGIKTLVELKKTQRLEDYPIISKLVLAWFEQRESSYRVGEFHWAIANIFTVAELVIFFNEHPAAVESLKSELTPPFNEFARKSRAGEEISDRIVAAVSIEMQGRIADLQQADRRHWRRIIAELKQLRADGKLMPEDGVV